jgi:hypothetical protein
MSGRGTCRGRQFARHFHFGQRRTSCKHTVSGRKKKYATLQIKSLVPPKQCHHRSGKAAERRLQRIRARRDVTTHASSAQLAALRILICTTSVGDVSAAVMSTTRRHARTSSALQTYVNGRAIVELVVRAHAQPRRMSGTSVNIGRLPCTLSGARGRSRCSILLFISCQKISVRDIRVRRPY